MSWVPVFKEKEYGTLDIIGFYYMALNDRRQGRPVEIVNYL